MPGGRGEDPGSDLGRLTPYIPDIREAARELPWPRPAILAAIALRETEAGWAGPYWPKGSHLGFGDKGYGFGIWQADLRTWEPALRGFMPVIDLMTSLGQARMAAHHLYASWRLLGEMFPQLPPDRIEAGAIAAYNARIGRVAAQLNVGADVDAVTTIGPSGKPDYSADVTARAARLERRHPQLFPPAGG